MQLTRRIVFAVLLILPCLLAAACGGGSGPSSSPTTTQLTPPPATATKPSTEPSPTAATGGVQANDEPVAFQTSDGVTVRGHLFAAAGPKRRLVVFAADAINDPAKTQKVWQPFARKLASEGIAALTFDFRGYGETDGSQGPDKLDLDLETAVRFARSREYPLIYVVGADIGATAALKVAERQELAGVVSVSGVAAPQYLQAPDLRKVSERKLFVASAGDQKAAADLQAMLSQAPEPKESKLFDGSANGSDLLSGANAAAFEQLISDFVSR